jgi:hypothetical protein
MASNDYAFITNWRVEATVEEVYDILDDALTLPVWWPAVYLDVRNLGPMPERGLGNVYELFTKGWLPYTLLWRMRRTETNRPHGFAFEAFGDFVGRGEWKLTADGPHVDVVFDWRLRAEKPILRALSFLMKPIFAANHRWAMARGLQSLQLELRRRRGEIVAAPPRPTRWWGQRWQRVD